MAKQPTSVPTSIRLDPDTLALLEKLKDAMGLNQSGVLRFLVREEARRRKLTLRDGE
jgi:hypothetical protein